MLYIDKQDQYTIIAADGRVLKRADNIEMSSKDLETSYEKLQKCYSSTSEELMALCTSH